MDEIDPMSAAVRAAMTTAVVGPHHDGLCGRLAARGHVVADGHRAEVLDRCDLVILTADDVAAATRLRARCEHAVFVVAVEACADPAAMAATGVDDLVWTTLPAPMLDARLALIEGRVRRRRGHTLDPASSRAGAAWLAVLDCLSTAVLVLDRHHRIVLANSAARGLLGAEGAAVLDQRLDDFAAWEPWAAALAVADQVIATRQPTHRTVEHDGQAWSIDAEAARNPVSDQVRIVLSIRDATAMMRLRRQAELNEHMASVGSLVAGVAHEVRNPLFGISAIADALELRLVDAPQHQAHLGMLRQVVKRLTRLMNELLALGTASRFDRERADLVEVLREARTACEPLAGEVGVAIALPERAPAVLEIDRTRISQVFQNLFDNALHHAPRGSTVDVQVGVADGGDRLWCSVRDRGPGFGVARDRAFEPFYSLRKGGTGLGLAIVRKIVDSHGGEVQIADATGGGAVVTIELPLAAHA